MSKLKQPLLNDENGVTVEYESRESWKRNYLLLCKGNSNKVKNPAKVLNERLMSGDAVFLKQSDQIKFDSRMMKKIAKKRIALLNSK